MFRFNLFNTIPNVRHISTSIDILQGKLTHIPIHKGFITLKDVMPRLVPTERPTLDHAIVDAARVSYGSGTKTKNEDRGLIRHLYRNEHTSPFEMVELKFIIRLPIFVERQWIRHRMANINEESGRYSILQDEFYRPKNIKTQGILNKQGSENIIEDNQIIDHFDEYLDTSEDVYKEYRKAIANGVSRETARIGLPLSLYTTKYWKCDLHNILRFLRLRMHSTAQFEIQEYANAMYSMIKQLAPYTCEAFEDYTLNSVHLSCEEIKSIKNGNNSIVNKSEIKEFNGKLELLGIDLKK